LILSGNVGRFTVKTEGAEIQLKSVKRVESFKHGIAVQQHIAQQQPLRDNNGDNDDGRSEDSGIDDVSF